MERVVGIEPTWPAWKAGTLPLSYTRVCCSEAADKMHGPGGARKTGFLPAPGSGLEKTRAGWQGNPCGILQILLTWGTKLG
jgi:hypothetical protein